MVSTFLQVIGIAVVWKTIILLDFFINAENKEKTLEQLAHDAIVMRQTTQSQIQNSLVFA